MGNSNIFYASGDLYQNINGYTTYTRSIRVPYNSKGRDLIHLNRTLRNCLSSSMILPTSDPHLICSMVPPLDMIRRNRLNGNNWSATDEEWHNQEPGAAGGDLLIWLKKIEGERGESSKRCILVSNLPCKKNEPN
jgi:hypothetical protein